MTSAATYCGGQHVAPAFSAVTEAHNIIVTQRQGPRVDASKVLWSLADGDEVLQPCVEGGKVQCPRTDDHEAIRSCGESAALRPFSCVRVAVLPHREVRTTSCRQQLGHTTTQQGAVTSAGSETACQRQQGLSTTR